MHLVHGLIWVHVQVALAVPASHVDMQSDMDPHFGNWLKTHSQEPSLSLQTKKISPLQDLITKMRTRKKPDLESYLTYLESSPAAWSMFLEDPLAPVFLEDSTHIMSLTPLFKRILYLYIQDAKDQAGASDRLIRNFPFLTHQYRAFLVAPSSVEEGKKGENSRNLIQRAIFRKQCDRAQSIYFSLLHQSALPLELDAAIEQAEIVAHCFRAKGIRAEDTAWMDISSALVDRFGKKAVSYVTIKRARVFWNGNQDDSARDLLQKILLNPKDPALADAWILLARIEENTGNAKKAIELYEKFISRFTQHDDTIEAQKSLAILYVHAGKWNAVASVADEILQKEDLKPIDDRSTSDSGFALLWGGRAYAKLGQQKQAEAYWMRLMKEYYSTYYGALGHYLLEESQGVSYPANPPQATPFEEEQLFGAYTHGPSRGNYFRTSYYLESGRLDEAKVEIGFLGDKTPEEKVGKSILLYAMKEFLPAIQLFGDVPRSVRNHLPRGVERIIFPRQYEEQVLVYAKKLEIDPDFVFSLIRQESVFNSDAMSSVGARGLMQLMEKTARKTESQVQSPYVNAKEKSYLTQLFHTKKEQALFESDFNIILGIHHLGGLLEKYKNPVFTLSAYNAGPAPTARWIEKYPSDDILCFIEKIPYKETKNYVKLIIRNYFYYKKWYSNSVFQSDRDMFFGQLFGTSSKEAGGATAQLVPKGSHPTTLESNKTNSSKEGLQ